jgi:hypothetical protein
MLDYSPPTSKKRRLLGQAALCGQAEGRYYAEIGLLMYSTQ